MAGSDLHKSFKAPVVAILDKDGTVLGTEEELRKLADDVHMVTDIAQYHLTEALLNEYTEFCKLNTRNFPCNTLGRKFKIETPPEIYVGYKTGNSRFREMCNDRLFREVKSWKERRDAATDVSDKYVSQGYKRTANGSKPVILEPKMSLSSADKLYAYISNDPFEDGSIALHIVISGQWRVALFSFDKERFSGAYKVTLPDVVINPKGDVEFIFSSVYAYRFSKFSETHVVSVDVGVTNYATVSVINVKTGEIEHSTTLSSLCHSLYNRVRNSNTQIASLHKQGRYSEITTHREANSRRKRELAIRAAQEVAQLSVEWGNTLIVVEDLSWVKNTMQCGRWNRGEFIRWVEFYAQLNGSRVTRVNPHMTSKLCPKCLEPVYQPEWHISICKNPECSRHKILQDRDVAATEVIARRFIERDFKKYVSTRKKTKKVTNIVIQRSPDITKRKGYRSDRTKNVPTPKRRKSKKVIRQWKIRRKGKEVIIAESKKTRSAPQTEELGVLYTSTGIGGMTVKSTSERIGEQGQIPPDLVF